MKTAIVTGASSGLGYEIASELIEKGVRVVNLSRTKSKLNVINIKTDLSKHKDVVKAIAKIKKTYDDTDLLILCAGLTHRHLVGETPLPEIDYDFSVNITSSIKLVEGLTPFIKKNKGDIVLVGSTNSFITSEQSSVYTASKHAVLGYIKSLQAELKNDNVRVIGVHPGGFKSQFHIKAGSGVKQELLMDPKDLAHLLITILELPRCMQVSEIVIDRKKVALI